MNVLSTMRQYGKVAGQFIKTNSPTILTIFGIGGMVAAVIMAAKQPVKVQEELYELEKEEERLANTDHEDPKHPFWPRAKIYIKHYWSTVVMMVLSATCTLFANRINLKRQAALLAAYQLSVTNYKDLKEKIKELDGEKKLQKLQDSIAKDKIESNPPDDQKIFVSNRGGDFLIYDSPSGRYFRGDIETVRRARDDVNRRLYNGESVTLNEFYDDIGLENIDLGNDNGWELRTTDNLLEIVFSSHINKFGEPCLVLSYEVGPLPY